jgi:dTMP kinase
VLTRDHELGADVETLVFVAARAQLLRELVAPSLARGVHVVCERFHPSTFAYQATAGGLDEQRVLALCQAWAGEPRPDLVLLLDLDVEHVSARRAATRDRIEDKGLEFQRQVAHGYRRYAELDRTVRVLDAGGTRAQVAAAILEEVRRALR